MTDDIFEFRNWIPETAAGTGDERSNDPDDPGFTADDDRLFRSHFQHANRLADRAYEQVRLAYQLGHVAGKDPSRTGRSFEQIETDLENGWLNARTPTGDWASVREFAAAAFDRVRLGRISETTLATESGRASYSDPVAGNIDPTDPAGPTP